MGNPTNSDFQTEFAKKLPKIYFFGRPDMSFFPGAIFAEGFPSNGGHEFQPKGWALGPWPKAPALGPWPNALALAPALAPARPRPRPGLGPFGPWANFNLVGPGPVWALGHF